ncbi:Chaperone SurA [wastewater metagenome]|uniref:Chaperone SurA n=2 Tax=unclassified sequences TaxID=12908 RepID=A0A5B8R5S1_9ZZZZ|nr:MULTISPECIES: peptidylprolyl isomerase [Arhodomonas]MCS4502658.1 peptidylprolyl isomerase [Arhodomonas aquaeolei]QEA03861.1 chaperone SurA [uncultured organism]
MPITINAIEISDEAVNIESANYEGGDIAERQRQAAVALAVRELLRQRAVETGLATEAEADDGVIDALIEREVTIPEAGDDDCRAYYENNRERFREPPRVYARHILLAALPDDPDKRVSQRDQAEALIAECRDGAPFIDLARRHSDCPSREYGGELGEIAPGATVPEFERAVWRLPEGLAARPVETRYGWHVVDVQSHEPGHLPDYETVRPRIADYLTERVRRRAFGQYVRLLAAEADIEGVDLDAADSPLVQ